jgi:hypothetical protein
MTTNRVDGSGWLSHDEAMWSALLGTVLVLFFLVRAVGTIARWRADLTSPDGIARRVTSGSRRHVVRFAANRFTWNPALPVGKDNRLYGPGTATYTLDEHGVVQLDVTPVQGEVRHYSGPLPEGLQRADSAPSLGAALLAPAVAIVGFVVGYMVIAGDGDNHFAAGAWLAIAAWVAASVILMVTNVLIRSHAMTAARAK